MNAFAVNRGTFLPEGPAALAMIEDALDHLVDGPRTSPSIVCRLVIRAVGDGTPSVCVERSIERFEDAYDRAFTMLANPAVAPAALDGGTRGRLIALEALLRTEWATIREEIMTGGGARGRLASSRSDCGMVGGRADVRPPSFGALSFEIPFGADFDDDAAEPDAPILMPEAVERRGRRRARLIAVGGHFAHTALRAAAVDAALAIVLAFIRLV